MNNQNALFTPLELPCGTVLKNRIAKSAMSDSLGDGTGHPTPEQKRLYQRWSAGGLALSIIGEVQYNPSCAEKPGNLVLNAHSDLAQFQELATAGHENNTQLWLQLGHAGALSYAPTSTPQGPSALNLPGLSCQALTPAEIAEIPTAFAKTAVLAQQAGFGGVQIHTAHGFLLSQFLSPLFNHRKDNYGGSIENRMRLLLECIDATRSAVGPSFPIAVKLNSSDQLEGGLSQEDALLVVTALDKTSIDLLDISGGTYFPGAKSASDAAGGGPYFVEFAKRARKLTQKPLMVTGGFKTLSQAVEAVTSGTADIIGLARAMAIEPSLANLWKEGQTPEPKFPRFANAPEGGVTAWYTMRLTDIATNSDTAQTVDLKTALQTYESRDAARTEIWRNHFGTDFTPE